MLSPKGEGCLFILIPQSKIENPKSNIP
jgi:hypothetical protein